MNRDLVAYSLSNTCAKNYQNQMMNIRLQHAKSVSFFSETVYMYTNVQ